MALRVTPFPEAKFCGLVPAEAARSVQLLAGLPQVGRG
jgi:hypothetical protein